MVDLMKGGISAAASRAAAAPIERVKLLIQNQVCPPTSTLHVNHLTPFEAWDPMIQ